MLITVTNRSRLVTARKAGVRRSDCGYRKRIRFRRSKVRGRKITVTLEFPGNGEVRRSVYSKPLTLRR